MLEDWRVPNYYYYRTTDLYIEEATTGMQHVLELGCGTGESTRSLLKRHETVVATDFSRSMMRAARKKAARDRRWKRAHLALCDAQAVPFRDEGFDAVVSRGTLLSYVQNPSSLLEESFRVLKEGGVVALDAMNYNEFIKERERTWQSDHAVLDLIPTGKGIERRLTRGGVVFTEHSGDSVRHIFFRKYDSGKKQVREKSILRDDSPLVKRFLTELSRGLEGPLVLEEVPEDLTEWTLAREEFHANYFTPQDLVELLSAAGFSDVSIHPLGHICEVTILRRLRYPGLSDLIRKNRDSFCLLEKVLSDHLRLETAWHLFAVAKKEVGQSKPSAQSGLLKASRA